MQAAASDKRVITISFGTAIQTYVPRFYSDGSAYPRDAPTLDLARLQALQALFEHALSIEKDRRQL